MKLTVGTPCPKSWDELPGNNRVRYCGQCNLSVYNLAVIPRDEVQRLIRQKEGRFCGRLYLRGDRKAATRDCLVGRDAILIRRIVKTAAVLLVAAFGWVSRSQPVPEHDQFPPWAQAVLDRVDPPPPPAPPVQPTATQRRTSCFVLGDIIDISPRSPIRSLTPPGP